MNLQPLICQGYYAPFVWIWRCVAPTAALSSLVMRTNLAHAMM